MTHAISAVVTRYKIVESDAKRRGLCVVVLDAGLSLIPLCAEWVDKWADLEAIQGATATQPALNFKVVHHVMAMLAPGATFALIETDYFGGAGDQAAAVYCGGRTLMDPRRATMGPINEALRQLDVSATPGLDEFDTVGLGRFRTLDDLRNTGARGTGG